MSRSTWSLRRLHTVDDTQINALADVLIDCVEGDASVSFMHPLTRDRAVAFWRRVAHGVGTGERALLIAEDAEGICGTVQLVLDLQHDGVLPRSPSIDSPRVHYNVVRIRLSSYARGPSARQRPRSGSRGSHT